jgi:hypothetical protein
VREGVAAVAQRSRRYLIEMLSRMIFPDQGACGANRKSIVDTEVPVKVQDQEGYQLPLVKGPTFEAIT